MGCVFTNMGQPLLHLPFMGAEASWQLILMLAAQTRHCESNHGRHPKQLFLLSPFLVAVGAEAGGFRKGRLRIMLSSVGRVAFSHEVELEADSARRKGWAHSATACPARREKARNDLKISLPRLYLLAWRLGS